MDKSFFGRKLRGCRFVGAELRHADLRGTDLCGVSFRQAGLTDADLSGARLGRGGWRSWLARLAELLIGLIAGLVSAGAFIYWSYFFTLGRLAVLPLAEVTEGGMPFQGIIPIHPQIIWSDTLLNGLVWAGLALLAASAAHRGHFWQVLFRLCITGSISLVLAFALSVGDFIHPPTGPHLRIDVSVGGATASFGLLAYILFAFALVVFVAIAVATASTVAVGLGKAATAIVGAVVAVFAVSPIVLADGWQVCLVVTPFVLGWYIYRRALAEDPQFTSLRRWQLAFSAWSGTDFRDAILTRADLSGASIGGAQLSKPADLTRTRFHGAHDMHLAHVSGTILADRRVRELLVSGRGAGGDFDHADLNRAYLGGFDLRGARFCDAELTGADLSGADLTGADLTRATLIGADLSGATLTGACLDGWNIDTDTSLDGVLADYVFLDACDGSGWRERRPQGDDYFGPGDFTTLFQRALTTVDLIFRNGIDWDAFRAAFDELRARYSSDGDSDGSDQDVRVHSIENTPDGRLIIRVAVPERGDKDADYRSLVESYRQQLVALENDRSRVAGQLQHKKDLLAEMRRHNASLRQAMDIMVERQKVTINNIVQHAQEVTQMAGGDIIHQSGNFSGSIVNIKSQLKRVNQSIGTLPGANDATQKALISLVAELSAILETVSPDRVQEAETVATLTGELIDHAQATPKNPSLLKIRADGLLQAASAVADKLAPVVKIVEQIVSLLGIR